MACTGNADEICGSAYRINAYGPSFQAITSNHVVFEYATVHKWFQVNIDLKLDDHSLSPDADKRANIYGLMTEGATYPNIGSMIPAVFIQPNSKQLEVCLYLDGAEFCSDLLEEYTPDEWFTLTVEQFCWLDNCYVIVYKEFVIQFWWNTTPETFYNVDGVIGNTYKQSDIVAASGLYKDFNLDQSEDGSGITFLTADEPDSTAAANAN